LKVTYQFDDGAGLNEIFAVKLDESGHSIPPVEKPGWTQLSCHQCENCPLKESEHQHCPAALSLVDLLPIGEKLMSYDTLNVTVITEERTVIQRTAAQRAISSLMGLLLAISGCPITAIFQPMARFHLPFANEDETIYRVTSMYALAQYFVHWDGREMDLSLDSLTKTFAEIQNVNKAMAKRLREATTTDASTNAIIILDTYAHAVPFFVEDSLDNLRDLFEPYIKATGGAHSSAVVSQAQSG
jgi:hypothetical protein